MILLAGSDAYLERFNVLPSSTAGRPTKSVQLLILLPPISDYWLPPHKEGELERQPRWLYFTPFSLPYTQGCLHTHIICLLVFIYTHTDKHAAAWTLKIRSRSCEERGGGGVALMKYACMCLCLFVSVCFSFFWGGCYSTGRPENGELFKQETGCAPRRAIYRANSSKTNIWLLNPLMATGQLMTDIKYQ